MEHHSVYETLALEIEMQFLNATNKAEMDRANGYKELYEKFFNDAVEAKLL